VKFEVRDLQNNRIIVGHTPNNVFLILDPKKETAELTLPQARDLGMSLIQMADYIANEQRKKQMRPKPKKMHPRRRQCR
jgi:hypothetical protein